MSITPDANDLLLSGGKAPEPLKLDTLGYAYGGRILAKPKTYHVREYDPRDPGNGKPRHFDNGEPVWGVYVDLDVLGIGVRRLYAGKPRMVGAIRDAMRNAGVQALEVSGQLSIAWTGEEAGQGAQPAKTYSASYVPPGSAPAPSAVLSVPAPRAAPDAYPVGGPVLPAAALATVPASVPAPGATVLAHEALQRAVAAQAGALLPPRQAAPQAAYYTEPAPVAPVAPAPVPQAPPEATPAVNPAPVITQTIAAAMSNAGIPVEGYTIVPG